MSFWLMRRGRHQMGDPRAGSWITEEDESWLTEDGSVWLSEEASQ